MILVLATLNATQEIPKPSSDARRGFNGTWRRSDNGSTVTISVTGTSARLVYAPGTPDDGLIEQDKLVYHSTTDVPVMAPNGEVRTVRAVDIGTIILSADGNAITKRRVLSIPGVGDRSFTETYYRVK